MGIGVYRNTKMIHSMMGVHAHASKYMTGLA